MTSLAFCAAVDWGSSTFRLWLLATDGGIVAERRSDQGMLATPAGGFEAVLEEHLSALGASPDLPCVICGMAGARQGWIEARYLDVPTRLEALADHAVRPPCRRDVRILPGIAQRSAARPDVMRGEETQLLGLRADGNPVALVCMPGTHSKWIAMRDGAVTAFATFMTGEIFDVLARRSILSHAVATTNVDAKDADFTKAVKEALARPAEIAGTLFAIRPAQLLGYTAEGKGAAALSGILIGTELAGAASRFGRIGDVTLVAAGPLADLYAAALRIAGATVGRARSDDAVRRGLHAAAMRLWATPETEQKA